MTKGQGGERIKVKKVNKNGEVIFKTDGKGAGFFTKQY